MAKLVQITGVKAILTKLRATTVNLGKDSARGLKKGGLFLQRESQKVVPVDEGLLNKSVATINIGGEGFSADIIVHYGAGAEYAVYVHEDLEARHKEGKIAKYLSRPAAEKRPEILRIIYEESKL